MSNFGLDIGDLDIVEDVTKVETKSRTKSTPKSTPRDTDLCLDMSDVDFDNIEFVEYDLESGIIHRQPSGKPHYLVIFERKVGGFDIFYNREFPTRGGRQLNKVGMETIEGARKFVQNWIRNKKEELVKDENGVLSWYKKQVSTPTNIDGEIVWTTKDIYVPNYEVVEVLDPALKLPEKVEYRQYSEVPEFNEKIGFGNALFQTYLAFCKKNWSGDKFAVYMARKTNSKYGARFVKELLKYLGKVRETYKVNLAMQQLVLTNFGTVKFPELATAISIPHRKSIPQRKNVKMNWGKHEVTLLKLHKTKDGRKVWRCKTPFGEKFILDTSLYVKEKKEVKSGIVYDTSQSVN